MAVLTPQFESPTGPALAQLQAANAGENWMTQAAQREQLKANTADINSQAALRAQQVRQLQMLAPALAAKAQADQIANQNAVTSATIQQNFNKEAAEQLPQATQEFTDALRIPDFNAKADAMAALQAKYSWLGNTPAAKSLGTAIDNARVNAHQEAVKNMELEAQKAIWNDRTSAMRDVSSQRLQGTLATIDGRIQGIEAMAAAQGNRADATLNSAMIREYGAAATQLEIEAAKTLDPNQGAILSQKAQEYRKKMEELHNAAIAPAPASSPTPMPKSTVTTPETTPVQVKDWNEAKKLPKGTPYIGPDGQTYIRNG